MASFAYLLGSLLAYAPVIAMIIVSRSTGSRTLGLMVGLAGFAMIGVFLFFSI